MLAALAAIDPIAATAIVAAAVGPIGAYLVAARRLSGKVTNSDAEQLWAESKAIRDWSGDRMNLQDEEIKALRKNLDDLTRRFAAIEAENKILRERLKRYEPDEGKESDGG